MGRPVVPSETISHVATFVRKWTIGYHVHTVSTDGRIPLIAGCLWLACPRQNHRWRIPIERSLHRDGPIRPPPLHVSRSPTAKEDPLEGPVSVLDVGIKLYSAPLKQSIMGDKRRSVVHLPNSTSDNPYQDNLVTALNQAGCDAKIIDDSIPYMFSIIRSWKKYSADSIHVHWLCPLYRGANPLETTIKSLLLPIELILCHFLGISIVWTVHNVQPHEVEYPRLYILLCRLTSRVSDNIIVHCGSAVDDVMVTYRLPRSYEDKIHVVPHGNYIDNYPNTVDQSESRSKLKIQSDVEVYLFFGTIRENKGVESLITAFTQIDDPDIRLMIVGDPKTPDHRKQVERLAEKDSRVEFSPGFVPDDELQYYFNAADAVVLPFSSVLTSGSAILSLSFGSPTVLPAIGCVGELNGGTIFYDPTAGETVLDGLNRARERDLSRIGAEALSQAQELDWESIAEETKCVYDTGVQ